MLKKTCQDVREYVQRIHDRCCLTFCERAESARYNRKHDRIYKAEVHFHTVPNAPKIGAVTPIDPSRSLFIYCGDEGHGPCFTAELVKNLVVELDNETGRDRVTWDAHSKRHEYLVSRLPPFKSTKVR